MKMEPEHQMAVCLTRWLCESVCDTIRRSETVKEFYQEDTRDHARVVELDHEIAELKEISKRAEGLKQDLLRFWKHRAFEEARRQASREVAK